MKRSKYLELQRRAAELACKVFPFVQPAQIEIAGFGLEDDAQMLALINLFNETFCGKLLVSLPGWTCPFHHHLSAEGKKDEGFYVVFGMLIVIEPDGKRHVAMAGETIYMPAGTIHALTAGSEGAVYFEFSERDNRIDVFDDTLVKRDPPIEEDVPGYVVPEGGFRILGATGIRLKPHMQLQVGPI